MLIKTRTDGLPHWVKNEVDPMPARVLCCWNKIRVAGYEYDLRHQVALDQRSDIQPDTHINTLLHDVEASIMIG